MRRRTARHSRISITRTATAEAHGARLASTGLVGIVGVVLLLSLMLAREGAAEPAALASTALELEMPVLTKIEPTPAAALLEPLLVVRHAHFRSQAEIADESIAAAVALGTNPDLEKKSAFRKKSTDLFRTEREVEIGQQEMLVRLRLRAKKRETMSVEVRF